MKRILITVLAPVLLLSGCKSELLGEYYLGELANANPYTGYEELVYVSSTNDTIYLFGKGRNRNTSQVYPSVNSNDYYIVEEDYTLFVDQFQQHEIRIKLATSSSTPPELSLRLLEYTPDNSGHITYLSYFILPLTKENLLPGQYYHDSLFVFNRYHYNVFSDSSSIYEHENKSISNIENSSVFYYNIQQGLLKIDFNDGASWNLIDIY